MHRLEVGHIDPRVDLGRGDRRMAEHRLDVPDVGAALEHVGGEGVAVMPSSA